MKKDSVRKSLLKSFSWRVVATLTTILISWVYIGDVTAALTIGFFEFFLKMLIYYFHERAWNWIPEEKLLFSSFRKSKESVC